MLRWILPSLCLTGCFQVTSRPVCEDVDVREVADDEQTPLGTADELLARVQRDVTLPGAYQDDTPVDVELLVARGAGPATLVDVETTSHETRTWGFGRNHLLVLAICEDELRVPLEGDVQTVDGEVVVPASGHAVLHGQERMDAPDGLQVLLQGRFADATFPVTENDPADFEDKYSFINLMVTETGELVDGSAGWGGSIDRPDTQMALAEYVVTF